MSQTSPYRPKSRVLRNMLVTAAAVTCTVLGILYVQEFMKLDPFARLRSKPGDERNQVAFEITNAHIAHYRGGKLMTTANVGAVEVMRDRQTFRLQDVSDGVYYADKNQIHFETASARWSSTRRALEVTSKTHLVSKDFDLQVPSFRYNDTVGKLFVPGKIQGTIYKGLTSGENLSYNLRNRSATLENVSWSGKLDFLGQVTGGDKKGAPGTGGAKDSGASKDWNISAKFTKVLGDIATYTQGRATTDDTAVIADKIVHNQKTDVITATGHVQYYGLEANMTCDKVVVYRKERRAVLSGNVNMLVKPKEKQNKVEVIEIPPFRPEVPADVSKNRPQPQQFYSDADKKLDENVSSKDSARRYPISLTAENIEYWYRKGNRHAIITGHPQGLQEFPGGRWRRVWAFKALYDGEGERLKLLSDGELEANKDVRVKTSLGDDLKATTFETTTKEDINDFEAMYQEGIVARRAGDDDDDTGTGTGSNGGSGTGSTGGGTTGGGNPLSGPIGKKGRGKGL